MNNSFGLKWEMTLNVRNFLDYSTILKEGKNDYNFFIYFSEDAFSINSSVIVCNKKTFDEEFR